MQELNTKWNPVHVWLWFATGHKMAPGLTPPLLRQRLWLFCYGRLDILVQSLNQSGLIMVINSANMPRWPYLRASRLVRTTGFILHPADCPPYSSICSMLNSASYYHHNLKWTTFSQGIWLCFHCQKGSSHAEESASVWGSQETMFHWLAVVIRASSWRLITQEMSAHLRRPAFHHAIW